MPKPRKNQQTLDFIEDVRKQLGDYQPRSFGMYMKIYKDFGREKMAWAVKQTLRRNPDDKFRYFLGIFWKMKEDKESLKHYKELRATLVQKMTPSSLQIDKKRVKIRLKIARLERKTKKKIKESGT